MVTLWLIESLARAGKYDPSLLAQAVGMLEDFIGTFLPRSRLLYGLTSPLVSHSRLHQPR
jgi:hypothetical protein